MERLNLTHSFSELVWAGRSEHEWLRGEYAKVRRVLKEYAASRDISLSDLTLLLVCDDRDSSEISRPLSVFIDRLQRPSRYKQEVRSRLRRILRALWPPASSEEAVPIHSPASDHIPDFMVPILRHLPRHGKPGVSSERRMEYPLSEQGQLLLAVLLLVAERHSVTNLDAFFIDSRPVIYHTITQELPRVSGRACGQLS
jgi:hypothetical protein